MAILKDIGRHFQFLSNDSFDRVTPVVYRRLNIFDDNGKLPFQGRFFRAHENQMLVWGVTGSPARKSAKNLKVFVTEATSINVLTAGRICRRNSRFPSSIPSAP